MRISDWSSDVCSSDLADRTMHLGPGEFMPTPDLAIAMRKITRQGSERIGRAAAAAAAGRRGRLTIVTKSNVLKVSRSEEHTSELPSLMRIPYAVFCLKKKQDKRTYPVDPPHSDTIHHL